MYLTSHHLVATKAKAPSQTRWKGNLRGTTRSISTKANNSSLWVVWGHDFSPGLKANKGKWVFCFVRAQQNLWLDISPKRRNHLTGHVDTSSTLVQYLVKNLVKLFRYRTASHTLRKPPINVIWAQGSLVYERNVIIRVAMSQMHDAKRANRWESWWRLFPEHNDFRHQKSNPTFMVK